MHISERCVLDLFHTEVDLFYFFGIYFQRCFLWFQYFNNKLSQTRYVLADNQGLFLLSVKWMKNPSDLMTLKQSKMRFLI